MDLVFLQEKIGLDTKTWTTFKFEVLCTKVFQKQMRKLSHSLCTTFSEYDYQVGNKNPQTKLSVHDLKKGQ